VFAGPSLCVASTFTGLLIGTFAFGYVADKYGRRTVFTYSTLWYRTATSANGSAFIRPGTT
jgi:MFS transporter, putative metabolite:H+ symporter